MARRQRLLEDADSSESEFEVPIRIRPRQRTARARNTPETQGHKIGKSPKRSAGSGRSSLLRWNATGTSLDTEGRTNGGSRAGRTTTKRYASKRTRDLPLSDPNS